MANEHHGNIIGVRLDVDLNNKLVAVGDLMRSVTLLAIPEEDGQEMKEMARDWGTHWITEVSMMPPGPDGAIAAIASDNIGNILLFERIVDPYFANSNGEKKWLMKATGGFHVGEIVNRIIPRTGALLGRHGSSSTNCNLDSQTLSIVKDGNPIQNSALVATANGSLLIIGEVSDVHYEIFQKISNAMEPQGYGGNNVSNCELRRPMTFKRNVLPSKDGEGRVFVDLDLVISFSNLTREKQHQVLQASESYLKLSEVLSLIEEIRTFNY